MDEKVVKWYVDAYLASKDVLDFVEGISFDEYQDDRKTRNATERCFEIIGEALSRVRKFDESLLTEIREYRAIIGFRNHLAHGYDQVNPKVVWSIIKTKLPLLIEDLEKIEHVKENAL